MSTAIAMAPSPAPHDRTTFGADGSVASSKTAASSPSAHRTASTIRPPPPPLPLSAAANAPVPRTGSGSPHSAHQSTSKSSPPSVARSSISGPPPKIVVKKEPASPDLPGARHRPRKLDLSKNSNKSGNPGSGRPLTARDGGNLGIQEVGIACLSPGFVTQDPVMKEQLQRSLSVREHQRQIIEARLQQQSAKGTGPEHAKDKDNVGQFTAKTPGLARKRGAPPGLSIVAPSHEQFANERVIQSAPLGQTFTGRHNPHPLTRHIANQPSNLSSTSHIHHVPATQTNNRLPPISDVFGQGLSGHTESSGHSMFAQHARAPLASPSHPPPPPTSLQHVQQQQPPPPPPSARPREYKSAEEAQAELAAGRPELLPKLVHYGGHQPPTPPSPQAGAPSRLHTDASRSASRRRTRAEYEDDSPPLGHGRASQRRGPFEGRRDSPESQRAKREEFLKLCERAWDLFHS